MAGTGKRKALGRGIDALIKDGTTAKKAPKTPPQAKVPEGGVQRVAVSRIVASPWQPRSNLQIADCREERLPLVQSLRADGCV